MPPEFVVCGCSHGDTKATPSIDVATLSSVSSEARGTLARTYGAAALRSLRRVISTSGTCFWSWASILADDTPSNASDDHLVATIIPQRARRRARVQPEARVELHRGIHRAGPAHCRILRDVFELRSVQADVIRVVRHVAEELDALGCEHAAFGDVSRRELHDRIGRGGGRGSADGAHIQFFGGRIEDSGAQDDQAGVAARCIDGRDRWLRRRDELGGRCERRGDAEGNGEGRGKRGGAIVDGHGCVPGNVGVEAHNPSSMRTASDADNARMG